MTLSGVAAKSLAMLGLCVATGAVGFTVIDSYPGASPLILVGALVGLGVAILTIMRKPLAPVTTPVYVAIEGLVAGAISAYYNAAYPGIAEQALLLELGVFAAMLVLFLTRIIKVTQRFVMGVAAATGAVVLYMVADLIVSLFTHGGGLPGINGNSPLAIIFSVVVIVIAAFNLVVDFGFIENGVMSGAPRYMEWYATFGLFVTLIWLYLELLRLVSQLRSR